MARPKRGRGRKAAKPARRRSAAGTARKKAARSSSTRRTRKAGSTRRSTGARKSRTARKPRRAAARPRRSPRLDRERRILGEDGVPTPPSSLNMDRHGSAARTGRAELAESREEHAGMSPDITGGDVDVDVEDAYFTGDEAPGGDNPTPDQDIVDDIGKALGVQYDDNEELKSGDKIAERDRHRWEMDPASAEDYKDRK